MRLPRTLKISGYTLNIQYNKKVGKDCYGEYDPNTKTIILVKGMTATRKKEIFIHEYMHFLEDIYRIKLTENNVSVLALGVLQLLTNEKVNLK